MMDVELSVVHTFPILEALAKLDNIGSAEVDLGKLAVEYKEKGGDVDAFVAQAVRSLEGRPAQVEPKDVVLYGFGRIGRILSAFDHQPVWSWSWFKLESNRRT